MREVRRSLFMARLHLSELTADEATEFVNTHLDQIAHAFAEDFEGQLAAPELGSEWRWVFGIVQGRTYAVFARLMIDGVVELRRIEIK